MPTRWRIAYLVIFAILIVVVLFMATP